MSRLGSAARQAVTLLTVLPVRGPATLDSPGTVMLLAPLVGLLLAVPCALLLVALDAVTRGPAILAAAATIAALAGATRGLHLDGLADLADGLGSYAGPERARAVMKQPDVGALGVATVALVLLVQVGALSAAASAGRGAAAVIVAVMTGRLALTAACTRDVPSAALQGLGAQVAGSVGPGWTAGLGLMTVAVGGAATVAEQGEQWSSWLLPAAAVVAGLLVARLVRGHAVARLGGITGDVLGALLELATTAALVIMALAPHTLTR